MAASFQRPGPTLTVGIDHAGGQDYTAIGVLVSFNGKKTREFSPGNYLLVHLDIQLRHAIPRSPLDEPRRCEILDGPVVPEPLVRIDNIRLVVAMKPDDLDLLSAPSPDEISWEFVPTWASFRIADPGERGITFTGLIRSLNVAVWYTDRLIAPPKPRPKKPAEPSEELTLEQLRILFHGADNGEPPPRFTAEGGFR